MPFIWKPKDTLETHGRRDVFDYVRWAKEGQLLTMPGRTIDPDIVAAKIIELCATYDVLGLAYDRWRIEHLLKAFEQREFPAYKGDKGEGLRLVDWGQGFATMAPTVDAFERSVLERRLVHPGNPVLSWNVANAVIQSDPAGNRKLDKQKARFRIDGAVAAAMALGLKAREAKPPGPPEYRILFV
jgi:phage terminase large subunit-like protein